MKKASGFKQAFHLSLQNYLPALKSCWPALLLIFLFSLGFKQYFSMSGDANPMNPHIQLIAALGKLCTSMISSLMLFLTLPPMVKALMDRQAPPKLLSFYRKHDLPLIIESLRAMVRILLWSLLFLIPGIIKQIRYSFMPFIVMFDPTYEEDPSFDPLVESERLSQGILLLLSLTLLVSSLDLLVDSYSQPGSILTYPLQVFSFFYTCFFNIFFFCLYMVRRDQLKAAHI